MGPGGLSIIEDENDMDSDFSGDDKQNPNEPNQVPGEQDIFDGLPIDGIQQLPDGSLIPNVEQQLNPDELT